MGTCRVGNPAAAQAFVGPNPAPAGSQPFLVAEGLSYAGDSGGPYFSYAGAIDSYQRASAIARGARLPTSDRATAAVGRRYRAHIAALANSSSERHTCGCVRPPKLHTRSSVSTPIASSRATFSAT